MKIRTFTFALSCLLFSSATLHAKELLGSTEAEIKDWASHHGYTVEDTNKGTSGCHKGKQFVELSGGGVKVYALFYNALYHEASQKVTQVEFEPSSPVPLAKARTWAVQVAEVAGTRPGTQKQLIEPGNADSCAPLNGGFEERYTGDYLVEYHYAPGGTTMVERVKVSNEGVR